MPRDTSGEQELTTAQKLHAIAAFVRTIPIKQFDMTRIWDDHSVGCVIGHLANKRMFGTHPDMWEEPAKWDGGICEDVYSRVAKVIGITTDQAIHLFGTPSSEHTGRRSYVANKIDRLAKLYGTFQ